MPAGFGGLRGGHRGLGVEPACITLEDSYGRPVLYGRHAVWGTADVFHFEEIKVTKYA
jgi:hypothetical protein